MDFTDRYKAAGIPHPDPKKVCKGPCEGMGVYPMPDKRLNDGSMSLDARWTFVKCEICNGTGKRQP